MEYLTIQEPSSSHFRGMERHHSDGYGNRPRDDFSRHPRLPSIDRSGSPSHSYNRSEPAMSNSASKPPRWPSPDGGSFFYPRQSSEPSATSTLPASRLAPPSSLAALLRPTEQSEQKSRKTSSPEWNQPVQPVPVRPTSQAVHDLQVKEEQQPLKLPSFNSLVEQIERHPEANSGGPRSIAAVSDAAWKRPEPTASFPLLEPLTFQFGGREPSGRENVSSPAAHHIAASEPTSPHAYSASGAHRHLLSPQAQPASPRLHRGHVRRSSDYRNRAFTQLSPPPSHELRVPGPFPTSHHRTQTFPSYHAVPGSSGLKDDQFQQLPPQPLAQEYAPLPPLPGTLLRHPPLAPAPPGHPLGHVRNDSVMNTTEESRFYSSTFQASAGSTGQTRKRRGNLPKDATRVLRQWFDDHMDAPYPGEEVKNQLCMRTGLQMSQVNNWFINARRRLPRQDKPRKERESTDVSDGSPSRDRLQKQPCPPEYWT